MDTYFMEYSKILDEKNDRHERIYKTNRDITNKSKKIIFSLQRIPGLPTTEKENILSSAHKDLRDIEQTLHKYVAMELKDREPYQFIGAYTGGLQEYIEAVAFQHFLKHDKIITHKEIQNKLIFKQQSSNNQEETHHLGLQEDLKVFVPAREYILGLSDFTGEMMRYCIKSISVGDFDMCYRICSVLKEMNAGFLSLGPVTQKDLKNKISVFRCSLNKVEQACYSLELRKSELPPALLGQMLVLDEE